MVFAAVTTDAADAPYRHPALLGHFPSRVDGKPPTVEDPSVRRYCRRMAPLALTRNFEDARRDFLERARALDAEVTVHDHPQPGPDGELLATDIAWLGAADAPSVVVVVSGTHGVEGYAGSALQRTWLRDAEPRRPDHVALCVVHALNPYGFAWVRRVNEDNVDLNRNFVDFDHPPANPGYDAIADLLVPDTWDDERRDRTTAALLEKAGEVGLETFQRWVSGGQYAHPDGLFYGGREPVWSHRVLDTLLVGALADRDRIVVIDLHTGLGPRGVGELISSDAPSDSGYERAVGLFGDDVTSLQAGGSVSAELSGEWLPYAEAELAPAEVTAVALEFGTVDAVGVLQALRADAWLHAHGDPTSSSAAPIKAELRAAFADDDPAWIADLDTRFRSVLADAFAGLTPAARSGGQQR